MSEDGRRVVSGWTDGVVRINAPESGNLLHQVIDRWILIDR